MVISLVETTGENPGWLFNHEAVADTLGKSIFVWGGELYTEPQAKLQANPHGYCLELDTMRWKRIENR